jgi:peptide-methionine (S)-S-oxide reductase
MLEKATFAAGCFWGVEDTFATLPGVATTRVGYIGGCTENPTYQDVCGHGTGHAEAVEVTFDPQQIGYEKLLDIFWKCHDPTQLNRQGPDIGDQYRSAIFCHSAEQQKMAEESREKLDSSGRLRRRVVTEIVPAPVFWEAEAYHQKYHARNGGGCGF